MPMMNFRLVRPDCLIDINRISELDYHRIEGSDLAIGALCRHAALKESDLVEQACPMMHAAYKWVAMVQCATGALCVAIFVMPTRRPRCRRLCWLPIR